MTFSAKLPVAGCAAVLAALAYFVSGCGGGTGGGVGVGGTGNTSTSAVSSSAVTVNGPITGFGSVIVAGVRFDDSAATVQRDAGTITSTNLRLGMTVELSGSKSADGLTGTASQIRVFSELKGPAQAVQPASNTLTLLGSTIRIDASTVFDGVTGLAGIRGGDIVEAFGFRNLTSQEVLATRIEAQRPSNASAPVPVWLNGSVQNLNVANKTFTLNNQTVQYTGATVSGTLADGVMVRVGGTATSGTNVVVTATTVSVKSATLADSQELEFEGIVTEFSSRAKFKLNGISVDASSSALPAAQVALLANGVRCEVSGKVSQSVVRATDLSCWAGGGSGTTYEVSGTVSAFVSAANFTVRNQVIDASAASFSSGKIADLAVGAKVEVKGPIVGGIVKATTVKFD
jgi:Domain of unknown function (DUF5666)